MRVGRKEKVKVIFDSNFLFVPSQFQLDIYEELANRGETLAKSSLYYHLGELRTGGIIEVSGYREEGGGAPEKLWKLKTTEIHVDLLDDLE